MLRDVPSALPHVALTFRILGLLACVVALPCAGCSGVSCDAPHCPKDPLPTVQMTATCNNARSSKCSGKYNDWISCINNGTTCDPESQTSDSTSHAAAVSACEPKHNTYVACVTAP